ncbi:MAG: hypothetical protein EAZ08_11340 [Cytophagales bacterium]|nr:MAG: hypothetical protein EAZ08_11340 [Cytophagales bacterium]
MTNFFVPKNILYIKDYEFEDGTKKPKLLIILGIIDNELFVLQAITTSQDKTVPDNLIKHGCTNLDLERLSFYIFEKNKPIGLKPNNESFGFEKNTFIFFQTNISKEPLLNFLKYKGNIQHLATLSDEEYQHLVNCISQSNLVKRKLKPYFEELLKNLFHL